MPPSRRRAAAPALPSADEADDPADNFDGPADDEALHTGEDLRASEGPRLLPSQRPSKSQLKRDAHDMQTLGVAVAGLSAARLARLELPEGLRDAIEQYRRTRSHEGRRRQMQYVGKLMRNVDPEPLREAVAAATLGSAQETLVLHEAERWRDALLADDRALTDWLRQHEDSDAQRLRTLVRAARKEALKPEGQRNPRHAREIFQMLRPAVAATLAPQGEPEADEDDDA